MKAKLILAGILLAFCTEASAQDIIHTIDGRTIDAKVIEITGDHILFKTYDNFGGPDYVMTADRVIRIQFENGTEKIFPPYAYDYYGYRRDYRELLYGSRYTKANAQYLRGLWLTISGTALLVSSIVCGAMLADYNRGTASIHSQFQNYEMADHTASLNLGSTANGIGVSLNF